MHVEMDIKGIEQPILFPVPSSAQDLLKNAAEDGVLSNREG
jgi:hypothetical protein